MADQNAVTATDQDATKPIPSGEKISYAIGAKIKSREVVNGFSKSRLSPAFGLRWGRWRIGTNPDLDEWLSFGGIRKEPAISYDFIDSKRWSLRTSARLQNLAAGEAFELGDKGKNTVRARVILTYRAPNYLSFATELTQDLLSRGDGTTLSFGLSKGFEVAPKSFVVAGTGITWATAVHWRSANQPSLSASTSASNLGLTSNQVPSDLRANTVDLQSIGSGFGSIGLSLGYRYAYSKRWAFYSNAGFTRAIADLEPVRGTQWRKGAQIGVLYFGQF